MQSCVGAGAGAAKQVSQRQTVTVSDALTFTLQTRGPGTTYRYCPASMLRENLTRPTKLECCLSPYSDRKSTRQNSSHSCAPRMPSSARNTHTAYTNKSIVPIERAHL